MNNEIEMTNSNIEIEKGDFKWILGNLFFTCIIVIIAFFQLYVYYHNENKAKYICFASFFLIFIGLFVVSGNLPLSLLTAMLVANLLFKCGNIQILNNVGTEEEVTEEVTEEGTPDGKKDNVQELEPNDPHPDLEQKKPKEKYIKASNFEPYLTGDKNKLAYPAAPHILEVPNQI